MRFSTPLALVTSVAAVLVGCTTPATTCLTSRDCPADLTCQAGVCAAPDGGRIDGGRRDADPSHDAGAPDVPPLEITGWAEAPELAPVDLTPNRDSVVVHLPAVTGVQDYRVIVVDEGVTEVTSSADGHEDVRGATIFCAGRAQHAAPVETTPNEVLRLIEVLGITMPTRVVVEAIDQECPFVGWLGREHIDLPVLPDTATATGSDLTFPMRTEAEIRAIYGNLIYNGQGPGAVLARPAEPGGPPRVLARTEVILVPTGTDAAPMTFWEDWSDDSDAFTRTGSYEARPGGHDVLSNSRWNYYTYNFERALLPNQVSIDHGRLLVYAADIAQDIMGAGMLTPRTPVALSDASYTHVTFEVDVNASDRRYVWFSLCGPGSGSAYAADGSLNAGMSMTPFFYNPDGLSPYAEDWNCLQVFGFEGSYYGAIGEDKADASIRIILNRAQEGAPDTGSTTLNVSPRQLFPDDRDPDCAWCGWYGEWNAAHELTGMPLDALLRAAPRVRWDLYIRRNRVVVYLEGRQYACSDFPGTPLTMNEGALGFGQVLYHTSAEHGDLLRDDWVRSAQRRYLSIAPWIDDRSWDNLGWQSEDALPADFREDLCFVSRRTFDDWTVN